MNRRPVGPWLSCKAFQRPRRVRWSVCARRMNGASTGRLRRPGGKRKTRRRLLLADVSGQRFASVGLLVRTPNRQALSVGPVAGAAAGKRGKEAR